MIRSTALPLRLVPAPREPDLVQEPLPGLSGDAGPAVGALDASADTGSHPGDSLAARAPLGRSRGVGRLHLVGARVRVERGMATAEYAVGLVAACAFALVLYKLVTSTPIFTLLNAMATRALTFVVLK